MSLFLREIKMSIKEKVGHITPTWWVVIVLLAVFDIVLCVEFYPSSKPQQWYMPMATNTCVNSRQLASYIKFPQVATPYRVYRFFSKHGAPYGGMKTFHYRGGSEAVVLLDSRGHLEEEYFSTKGLCKEFIREGSSN